MSGASPPPDNSAQVEAMREQAQREAQQAADAKAAQHVTDLRQPTITARSGATGTVDDYFTQHGVDPTQYAGSIESQLNNILTGISPSDENPGSSFTGAGQSIWDALTTAGQTKAMNTVNQNFAPNFESTKVPFTLDDPYIAGIAGDQYNDADKIIQNMLARGVLTSGGAASAEADLANQKPGVTAKLTDIGSGLISKEQSDLSGIGNKARQAAGNIQLGQTFDPSTYSTQADQSFNDFIGSLGDQIRAQVPGKLFNTAGLAAIGGAGQGAGNTAFNPNIAAGTPDDTTDNSVAKPSNPNSIF